MSEIETVIFDMWGQRCEARFDPTSELEPITWIIKCYEKGFMVPIEIILDNGVVLYTKDQLLELLEERC